MDTSRNYQRAVTPTIGEVTGSGGGSSISGGLANNNTAANGGISLRGKPLAYPPPTNQSLIYPSGGALRAGNASSLSSSSSSSTTQQKGPGSLPMVQPNLQLNYQNYSVNQAKSGGIKSSGASSGGGIGGGISDAMSVQGKNSGSGGLSISNNQAADSYISGSNTPALPRYDLIPLTDELPADGIIFTRLKNQPDSLVVFRTPEERARNPERLNLDRRQLEICPILEQEQRLRLLNYQNNNIKVIQNIDNLPNLIFLDMYNNRLTSLEGPLNNVKGLRVLMAGKNKLTSITNLTSLKKLDVLDLHSNEIKVIEGLSGLNELRVLNLAGNKISIVQNLASLHSLTELNLRRNSIEKIVDLDKIPALQRVFLSHNNISSFSSIACLYNVKMLIELSMDGNELSESNPVRYRQRIVAGMLNLRHLDLKRITDDEKVAAIESCQGLTPNDPLEVGSNSFINSEGEYVSGSGSAPNGDGDSSSATGEARASTTSSSSSKESSLAALARSGKISINNDLMDLEIIGNNEKALIIVGEKWEWIQNRRLFSNVVEISLCHVKKDVIISKVIPSLSLLSTAKTLRLVNNGLELIRDILQLSELWVPYLEHIIIKDNPINLIGNIYEDFLIVKVPNILTINGEVITQQRKLNALKKLSPILYVVKASKEVPFSNSKNRAVLPKKGETTSSSSSSSTTTNKNVSIKGSKSNWDDMNASELLIEITQETTRRRTAQDQFNQAFELSMKHVVNRTLSALLQQNPNK